MYSYQFGRIVSLGLTALILMARSLGEGLWTFIGINQRVCRAQSSIQASTDRRSVY